MWCLLQIILLRQGRSLRAEVLAQQASRHNESRRSIDSLIPQSPGRDHLWGQSGVLATSVQAGELVERSRLSLDSAMLRHPVNSNGDNIIDGQHFPLPPGVSKPGLPWEGLVTPSQSSFSGSVVAAPAQEAGYRVRIECDVCSMQRTTCILNFFCNIISGHRAWCVCVCVGF